MELSLKNYTTTLTKELLKLAEKNIVRECDETEKGRYVAYVDEGEDSYDVGLTILKNGEIKMADCDCKNNKTFCRHKTALLLFITGAKKEKKPAKVKAKANKSDALLEDAALHELKDWVKNLLLKNPDIELAFVHHFSAKNNPFTTEEIEKLTNDAVKAVVKNKKNIDPTQLKKIVELWADIHAPMVQQYQAGAADENMFTCLHALLDCCMDINIKLGVNSKKIPAYVDGLLKTCVETIADIYDKQSWTAAISYFITHITDKNRSIRFYYLQHLQNIVSLSSGDRKKWIVDEIVNQYAKLKPNDMSYGTAYTQKVFEMVEEQGLFEKYYTVFKPVEWSNAYNEKLIGLLIDNKHHSLAEKYCHAQMAGNYREEYNIPYLKLLKQIYTVTGNEKGMAEVLTQLFPYTFLFEDYLFITARMNDDEEKKKWRTKILSRARNATRHYSHAAILFCFALADHEKKYIKMIEYIDSYTRYDIILHYFDLMAHADKTRLLQALLRKSDEYHWSGSMEGREKDDAVFPELYATVLKHYSPDYLKAAIKKAEGPAWYHRTGRFINYMKKSLGMS